MSKTFVGFCVLAAALAAAGLGLAAGGTSPAPHGGRVRVVAGENFYGDIAAQIGGRHVAVTSVLHDPNADPHLFEPGTATGLAVAQAALVIQNGAGYDTFMGKLEAAAPSPRRIVVTVADVLGVAGAGANPHVWYDVPRLPAIARAIAAGLVRADPGHRAAYRARPAPVRRRPGAARRRGRGDPRAVRGHARRLHRAGAGLPDRRRRSAQPDARRLRAGDRGRQRALARGGRADDRAHARAPRCAFCS